MANKLLPIVDQAMPGYELRKMRSDSDQRKALTKQGMDVARSVGEKETPSMAPQKTFNQAFKEARAAGKDTFSWNGKKYTTEMAGAKKPSAASASEPERETTDYDFGTTNPSEFKRGGKVKMSSASKRGDGCCQRGKTRGKMV